MNKLREREKQLVKLRLQMQDDQHLIPGPTRREQEENERIRAAQESLAKSQAEPPNQS